MNHREAVRIKPLLDCQVQASEVTPSMAFPSKTAGLWLKELRCTLLFAQHQVGHSHGTG